MKERLTNLRTKYVIKIKFGVLFLLLFVFFCCSKTEQPGTIRQYPNRELDRYSQIIIDTFAQDHLVKAVPFVTYLILDKEEDTFYERVYLFAMIDDIDSSLQEISSFAYPFSLTFDKEGNLVRVYYHQGNIIGLYNNFSDVAISQLVHLDIDLVIERADKMKATNLWNAESYYGGE